MTKKVIESHFTATELALALTTVYMLGALEGALHAKGLEGRDDAEMEQVHDVFRAVQRDTVENWSFVVKLMHIANFVPEDMWPMSPDDDDTDHNDNEVL